MAYNYTDYFSSTNTSAGSLLGGAIGGLGNYANQENYYTQYSALLNSSFVTIPAPTPTPIKKKAQGFIAELREEIDAWHGDILAA